MLKYFLSNKYNALSAKTLGNLALQHIRSQIKFYVYEGKIYTAAHDYDWTDCDIKFVSDILVSLVKQ